MLPTFQVAVKMRRGGAGFVVDKLGEDTENRLFVLLSTVAPILCTWTSSGSSMTLPTEERFIFYVVSQDLQVQSKYIANLRYTVKDYATR